MLELIVREIAPIERKAKYGNVDLGTKENLSRGAANATLFRPIPGTQLLVCITFLADTYHNRATLLEKQKSEKRDMEIFYRAESGGMHPLGLDWLDGIFGDITQYAPKADVESDLPAGMSRDAFDAPDHLDDGTPDLPISVALDAKAAPDGSAPPKEKPQPGPKALEKAAAKAKGATKTPAAQKPAPMPPPAASAPMPEGESEVSIRSLGDFLNLSMRNQMLALEAGMPIELLQDIATSDETSLEMDVKNEAFKRLNE